MFWCSLEASPDASSEPLNGCLYLCDRYRSHTCIYLYLLAFKLSILSAGSTCISRDLFRLLVGPCPLPTPVAGVHVHHSDLQAQFLTLVLYLILGQTLGDITVSVSSLFHAESRSFSCMYYCVSTQLRYQTS